LAATIHEALPLLAYPAGFFRRALADLRPSSLIGLRLFKAGWRGGHRRSPPGFN